MPQQGWSGQASCLSLLTPFQGTLHLSVNLVAPMGAADHAPLHSTHRHGSLVVALAPRHVLTIPEEAGGQ